MRKLFITVCELDDVPYLPEGASTRLFGAPLYEHAYRKIKDAANKLDIEVEFVRAATFPVRGAKNEFDPDFEDIVAVISPLAFLAHARCIEDGINFVIKNDPAFATVGHLRSPFAVFGLGKMVSGAAVGSCQDFIHHISECGAVYKNIAIADGEKSVPVSRIEYLRRVTQYREEFLDYLVQSGVTIELRDGITIAPNTEIRQGTVIKKGVTVGEWTRIRENCEIGPDATVTESDIHAGVEIGSSVIKNSIIEENCEIGSYSIIEDECKIAYDTKIGNNTELRDTVTGSGVVIGSGSYIVNSDIGLRAQLGAGVRVVNHSGSKERRCRIESEAVIGCGANLISPLLIGTHAHIGAGSTITDDVPANALGISRAYQTNRDGWARKRK